jgi:hypothetical protein
VRRQGHELVGAILPASAGAAGGDVATTAGTDPSSVSPLAAGMGNEIRRLAGKICPITGAAVPIAPFDRDLLRRQAHEFIEALLVTFNQATGEKPAPFEDQVPLLRCAAPVAAGQEALAEMRVVNEEGTPSEVALYCTNFVADSGYEIPSSRVTVSPRRVTIAANGEASFVITIAISPQTPAGTYSGLIQAMGSRYVKAVLSVEVQ